MYYFDCQTTFGSPSQILYSEFDLDTCGGFLPRVYHAVFGSKGSDGVSVGHLTSIHSQEEMDILTALYDSVRTKRVSQRAIVKLTLKFF